MQLPGLLPRSATLKGFWVAGSWGIRQHLGTAVLLPGCRSALQPRRRTGGSAVRGDCGADGPPALVPLVQSCLCPAWHLRRRTLSHPRQAMVALACGEGPESILRQPCSSGLSAFGLETELRKGRGEGSGGWPEGGSSCSQDPAARRWSAGARAGGRRQSPSSRRSGIQSGDPRETSKVRVTQNPCHASGMPRTGKATLPQRRPSLNWLLLPGRRKTQSLSVLKTRNMWIWWPALWWVMMRLYLPVKREQAVWIYNWCKIPQSVNQSCSQHPVVSLWQRKELSAGTTD